MKKFTFKGVLDGFRSTAPQTARPEQDIQETLRPENFQVKRTFRHGFPFQPTAMAFDPVQRLLAIGSKCGSLRILGRPGVDVHVRHDMDGPPGTCAVMLLQFLVNEGALISCTADDTIHLWNFRQKVPQVVQSLKFQREKVTCMSLPLQSKWLYVGTERGNIHVVQIESFALSGYIINWNKAIEVSRKTHPGPVVHLSDNPLDHSKLCIGYESGQIVLWDLRSKNADFRCQTSEPVRSIAWHHEGKQFMVSHIDGSLTTWSIKQNTKPIHVSQPHAKLNKEGKLEQCKPITKVEWKSTKSGEAFVIFSGGMPYDQANRTPSITVVHSKSTTVLEMEHPVVDFITLCESPYTSELQEPYAIIVLLQNDLVVMDLQASGYPWLENPYPMDIHESPVTCCSYLADCPGDLIPAFYSVGRSGASKRQGLSEMEWPMTGGEWSAQSSSYYEIIITGHADGSVKFWDASAGTLQVLYKLKTAKVFDKPKCRSLDTEDEPFAIQIISFCPESRKLCIAGASSHVILFKFRKNETNNETTVLEIPIVYEVPEETEHSPECEFSGPGSAGSGNKMDMLDPDSKKECALKVKSGVQRKVPGFQAQLVCLTPWNNGDPPGHITALTVNSSYGLMAYGNESGIVIVDIVQKICLLNVGSPDLYGAQDPYQRVLRSPKKGGSNSGTDSTTPLSIEKDDRQPRSPSIDQLGLSPESPQSLCPCPSTPQVQDAEQACEALEDVSPSKAVPIPRSTTRRMSATFKQAFNLKRQISKVDMKLKNTFNSDKDQQPGKEKRGSVFYCPSASPPQNTDDIDDDDDLNLSPDSEENTITEKSGSDDPDKEVEGMEEFPVEGAAEEGEVPFVCGSLGHFEMVNKKLSCPARPTELKFVDENGLPIRPPRNRKKTPMKREQRLMSVPNIKFHKGDLACLRDLREKDEGGVDKGGQQASFAGNLMRRFNKLDNSFSRSRSSSMSSLENISSEAIQCLAFADSYSRRTEPWAISPTLWIGTSLGSVLPIIISLPDADSRSSQPVVVSLVGVTIFRLKGSILAMSFLDCNGALMPYSFESWKDDKDKKERTPTRVQNRMSPTLGENQNRGDSFGDNQFVVLTSEKQARVVALPSQTCIYRTQISDIDFVVKCETISLKDSVCLVCYVSNGHLMAYSLPSLRLLVDIDFLPLSELSFQTHNNKGIVDPMLSIWGQQLIINEDTDQIAKTFCFSNRGHGMYLASPSELQKFTLCTEFCSNLTEMMGELFLAIDMPEPPKDSFFKGLFGGGLRTLDREELFGESSGKGSKAVAKHIPGSMQEMGQTVTRVTGEVGRAHQLMLERGDKLNQLEERTQRLMNESENFSGSAHSLMLKYKDKKWYQL